MFRNPDGFFEFEHRWKEAQDSSLKLDQAVRMSADELWNHDLRSHPLRSLRRKRLKQRSLWRALKTSAVFSVLLLCFILRGLSVEAGRRE